jgi:hypothetical protein
LAYFLNSPHPNLKSGIQLLLIETAQDLLYLLKKLLPVSQLNPFEFFFAWKKQVEVIQGQIGGIEWVGLACVACHVVRENPFGPDL